MILFLADVGVKVNRKTLLCKRGGGDAETCEIEDPPSRAASTWGGEGAASKVLQVKIMAGASEERFHCAETPGFLLFSKSFPLGGLGASCDRQLLDFQWEVRIDERGASIHIQDLPGDPVRFRRTE